MRDNEKIWVTAVSTVHGWGERTKYLRSEKGTFSEEWEQGVVVRTVDSVVMYIKNEHLVSIEFDTEDLNDGKEG